LLPILIILIDTSSYRRFNQAVLKFFRHCHQDYDDSNPANLVNPLFDLETPFDSDQEFSEYDFKKGEFVDY
jgi:hypothetical protein